MLTTEEIKFFIDEDSRSAKKREAKRGLKYYEGKHDIADYRLFYFDADGKLQEDKTRSNIKISHPFFTELVDQEVQYMLSGEQFLHCDDEELQEYINSYFDDDFKAELHEVLTGAVSKGFDFMYAYKSINGKLRFQHADSMGVVEIRAKDTSDKADYVIYWYMDRIAKDRKEIKRVQVWDQKQTFYYVQDGDGKIELDESQSINPRPHVIYTKDGDPELYYSDLGFIPFFRLDNNIKQVSGLAPVKSLIDDYDLMSCGLSNNIQDVVEGLYVVSGFKGDSLDEMITNLKTKKAIGVDDHGSVDIKTIDIPTEARRTKLELDEKNIYRFGMGFNSAQIGDGNVTNVVIRSRYALLDLKCNKLEIRLKQFLRKLIRVVIDEINKETESAFTPEQVKIKFEREIMTNALDNAQIEKADAETEQIKINTLLNVATQIGDEELLRRICDVLDIDYGQLIENLPEDPEEEVDAEEETLANVKSSGQKMYATTSILQKYGRGSITRNNAIRMMELVGWNKEEAVSFLDDKEAIEEAM